MDQELKNYLDKSFAGIHLRLDNMEEKMDNIEISLRNCSVITQSWNYQRTPIPFGELSSPFRMGGMSFNQGSKTLQIWSGEEYDSF